MKCSKNKVGLILAAFMAIFHALWCVLVVTGAGQWLLNFIYKLHFLNNPFLVAEFAWGNGLLLIVVTAVVGYVAGWVFALLWNQLHKHHQ